MAVAQGNPSPTTYVGTIGPVSRAQTNRSAHGGRNDRTPSVAEAVVPAYPGRRGPGTGLRQQEGRPLLRGNRVAERGDDRLC